MAMDSILSRRLPGAGVTLAVEISGEGPPVLMLHGFPENARSWRHQVPALTRAGFSVWVPNLRGYAGSDAPPDVAAYHLRHLVDDAVALIAATGAPRAHVVGHDWGGIIAWTLAGHHPALVDRLVIMNAPHMKHYLERVWRSSQLFRSWYVGLFLLPGVAERLLAARDFAALRRMFPGAAARPAFSAEDIEAYVAQFRRPDALRGALNYYRANTVRGGAALAAEARISADTLVLWGDKDPALAVQLLDPVHEVAPRARVRRFADVGHWIQNEIPEIVSRELVSFLTSRDPGAP
jgi:epoxide hydrolase 4